MSKARIMLLGATGQIGQTFQYVFDHMDAQPDWEMGCYTRNEFDMTNAMAMRHYVQNYEPSLIINCAAMSHVEEAEQDEAAAMAINFNAIANLAALASAQDTPIIHLSTDYVFDGRQNAPFTTEDKMNPANIYGGTKMMGEEALRYAMPWHVILRISTVLGPFGQGILPRIINMINQDDELRMVTDQVSCPTPALELCRAIIKIGTQILHGKIDGFGTFHYCGKPACSPYELAQEIIQAYAPYTDKRPIIKKATSHDFPEHVARPPYSALDCSKIKKIYDIDQPVWQNALLETINLLHENERR